MISECRLGPCCAACKILQIFMRHNKNNTRWFVQYSDSLNSAYKYLPSALLNGQITNGKWSTVKVPPGSVFLCQGPVPALLGWAYPEQLGLSSTTCGLVLGDSVCPCTNGISLLHRIASVAPLSKLQTMF